MLEVLMKQTRMVAFQPEFDTQPIAFLFGYEWKQILWGFLADVPKMVSQ